jgi:D-tagatose-1,6-bisphosphate aldolase subunit GatZ/KbaZ
MVWPWRNYSNGKKIKTFNSDGRVPGVAAADLAEKCPPDPVAANRADNWSVVSRSSGMKNPLQSRLKKHRTDPRIGIYSVCSANRFVLEAAMLQARHDNSMLLIESTSNQVDQFGGYSGMTPPDFVFFVKKIAARIQIPWSRILLGGDHLGPNVWQNETAESAMQKAVEQIRAYIGAGYSKIHLDTSMHLQGDTITSSGNITPELAADRAADLCAVAENFHRRRFM